MGILIFTARIHDLIHQKYELEYKLAKLTKKTREMAQYSSLVANGGITIGNLLSTPGSMMGRSMNYLAYAHNSAMQYMQQNAPMMQQMYMQQMGVQQNPQQQQYMNNYIMRSLYIQGRDMAAQIETKNLKEEEEKMASQKAQLEAGIAAINAELESTKKARSEDAQNWKPNYTGQA